jgi:outer membrane immunogenic protein
MKRIVLAVALLIGNSVSGSATDLLVNTPSVAVSAYNWSGFYAGLNAGFSGISDSDVRYDQLYNSPRVPISQSGLLIGGQAGFNWQSGITVFGIETDIQYRNASDGRRFLFPTELGIAGQPFGSGADDTTYFNSKQNWLGTLRGRVGLTTGPVLYYATGGLAYGEVKYAYGEAVYPGQIINRSISDSMIKVGWTVGAGVEMKLSRNWSAGMEYLYVDLGKTTLSMPERITATQFGPFLFPASGAMFDNTSHIFRVKLNYALNSMN